MVILAGVAISVAVGDGGVITRAQTATDAQKYKTAREQVEAQCVYITEGENVGKVDLGTTLENIKDLNLKEIEYSDQKTRIEGNSIKVTLKNGEVIIINGENYNSAYLNYYEIPGNPYNIDVFETNYKDGIVTGYNEISSNTYQAMVEVDLVSKLSESDITVDGNMVTVGTEAKIWAEESLEVAVVLEDKCYVFSDDSGTYGEFFPNNEKYKNAKFIKSNDNLYNLVEKGEVSIWATITGYGSTDWEIYKIGGGCVEIVPSASSWNATYTYDTSITNQQNLDNIEHIFNSYLNSEYATSVRFPTVAEAQSIYEADGNRNNFGIVYALGKGNNLVGANSGYSGTTGVSGATEFELNSNVTYKILPIITLKSDVKGSGGKYFVRIFRDIKE